MTFSTRAFLFLSAGHGLTLQVSKVTSHHGKPNVGFGQGKLQLRVVAPWFLLLELQKHGTIPFSTSTVCCDYILNDFKASFLWKNWRSRGQDSFNKNQDPAGHAAFFSSRWSLDLSEPSIWGFFPQKRASKYIRTHVVSPSRILYIHNCVLICIYGCFQK